MNGPDPFDAFSDPTFSDDEPEVVCLDHNKLPRIEMERVPGPLMEDGGRAFVTVYYVIVEDYKGNRYIHQWTFPTYLQASVLAVRVQERLQIDLDYWYLDQGPDFVTTFPDYVLDPTRPEFN